MCASAKGRMQLKRDRLNQEQLNMTRAIAALINWIQSNMPYQIC